MGDRPTIGVASGDVAHPSQSGRIASASVRRLDLTNFRSYAALRIETEAGPVALVGGNGAGKTNMLEAISFLSPGRCLRRAPLAEVARMQDGVAAGAWAVAARIDTPEGTVALGTGMEAAGAGPARRAVRIDGEPARGQAAFAERVSVVWLTPEMDRLFLESAGGRRRFLDRMVFGFDPVHATSLAAYEQAMRGRQRLLRENVGDSAWLAAEEETMATTGVAIAAARREVVARLDAAIAAGDEAAGDPFPRAAIALDGPVERWLDEGPALEAEDRLRRVLASSRARDAEAGRAGDGPHRSDLLVRHRGKDMPAALCSTGEQKALLVSIVLAHARLLSLARGASPVLLLDEVAAHLDPDRRAALAARILALGAQAWLTGTDASLFAGFGGRAQFFDVSDGSVRPGAGAP